eukprot:TRINITY_DN11095_c0_g2_i2.p1 TRINITY_DN11095_c0_g2~~TRINITY_DN11095_c0_g2_i2.p1  ORF type:complete len:443 (-),score=105.56 TRINITY_DN11095_c0_g2_i2:1027-2355(-)
MGTYLSTPVTDKELEQDSNELFEYGMAAMQGWRVNMEDAHLGVLNPTDTHGDALFGVFDGHGGKEVALFCAKYLKDVLVNQTAFKEGDIEKALKDAFFHMDERLILPEHQDQLKSWKEQNHEPEERQELDFASLPAYMQEAIRQDLGVEDGAQIVFTSASGDDAMVVEEEDEELLSDEELEGGEGGNSRAQKQVDENSQEGQANGVFDLNVDEYEEVQSSKKELPDGIEADEDEQQAGVATAQNGNQQSEKGGCVSAAGCTAVVAFVQGGHTLWVANAGDSRCVICRNGKMVAMTEDHKPTDVEESERIYNAGGYVSNGRINDVLNLSRAIGDFEYKQVTSLPPEQQMVTSSPDIKKIDLQHGDEFMVLGCDGIFEVLENEQVVQFVRERLKKGKSSKQICQEMCDRCLAVDVDSMGIGCDNMSVMIIVFKQFGASLQPTGN